jgi:hypothetical protein
MKGNSKKKIGKKKTNTKRKEKNIGKLTILDIKTTT